MKLVLDLQDCLVCCRHGPVDRIQYRHVIGRATRGAVSEEAHDETDDGESCSEAQAPKLPKLFVFEKLV